MKLNFNERDPESKIYLGQGTTPKTRRRNKTLAQAITLALLAGSAVPASGWAATLSGFVFKDINSTNGSFDAAESKVGGYPLTFQAGSAPEESKITDSNGHFTFDFDDTGDPTVHITNLNFPGWKQTTNLLPGSPGMAGMYTFEIESPYDEVRIGLAKGGTAISGSGPNVSIDVESLLGGGGSLTIMAECAGESYQVKLICSLPTGTTGYEIESCSWNFGDGTSGNGTYNGMDAAITVSHFYKNAGTYTIELGAVIVDNNNNTISYQTETQSLTVGNSDGDMFDCLCSSDRARYKSNGNQIVAATSTAGIPTDVVYISDSVEVDKLNSNTIPLNSYGICIDTGGELTEASSGGDLTLSASNTAFVYNRGTIRVKKEQHHKIGNNAVIISSPADQGGHVNLSAVSFIINDSGGKIKAGVGGNYIDHSNSSSSGTTEIQGRNGGDITLYSQLVTNHGHIGPEQAIGYNSGNLVTDGGNGGVGSRSSYVRRDQILPSDTDCDNWLSNSSQYNLNPSGHSGGNARGGNGGNITLSGWEIENWGTIKSGSGGDGRTYECSYPWTGNIAYPGEPGDMNITPTSIFRGSGTLDGSGGRILLEPVTITLDSDFRIINSSEVMIFGGDDAKIIFNNLSADAISSEGDIILAVGEGGTIDLRNNVEKIFKSTDGTVKIYADEDSVPLDDGIVLEDLIEAPEGGIQVTRSKILYAVTMSGSSMITGAPGATVSVDINVQNSGPNTDTYVLTVTDSEGWQLGSLPSTITVDGLDKQELKLDVTLSTRPTATDTITVTATSQTDTTVVDTTEVTVKVDKDPNLAVKLADFTATAEDGSIRLDWETASEIDNAGFFIMRARKDENGEYTEITRITPQPIPSVDGSINGASYSYRDFNVVSGNTYYYAIKDIEFSGETTLHLKLIDSATAK